MQRVARIIGGAAIATLALVSTASAAGVSAFANWENADNAGLIDQLGAIERDFMHPSTIQYYADRFHYRDDAPQPVPLKVAIEDCQMKSVAIIRLTAYAGGSGPLAMAKFNATFNACLAQYGLVKVQKN